MINEPGLRAGFSEVDITPSVGAPVAGYYYPRRSTGVHDPLKARTIAMEMGDRRLIVSSCDAIRIPTPLAERFRAELSRRAEIPPSAIALCATHSHTAPDMTDDYCEELIGHLHRGAAEALGRLRPASLHSSRFDEPLLIYNRRYWMRDGTVRTNPGKQNPEILCPAGAVDPEVQVLEFRDESGSTAAVWVSFALHLDTVGGTLLSADFPHFMGETLRSALGKDLFPFFTIGAAGNLNHWNPGNPEKQRSFDEAERIGTLLARGVLRARQGAQEALVDSLDARFEMVVLEPFPASDEDHRAAAEAAGRELLPGIDFSLDLVHAHRLAEIDRVYGRRPLRCPLQSLRLGRSIGITLVAGEPFAELGLTIKDHSPFPTTLVAGLSNGYLSYFPTRTAYRQGGYEVAAARVAPGEGERLVEASLGQLRSLLPSRPPHLRLLEKGTS